MAAIRTGSIVHVQEPHRLIHGARVTATSPTHYYVEWTSPPQPSVVTYKRSVPRDDVRTASDCWCR